MTNLMPDQSIQSASIQESGADVATADVLAHQANAVLGREFPQVLQDTLGYQAQCEVEVRALGLGEAEQLLIADIKHEDTAGHLLSSIIRLDGDELQSELVVTGAPASIQAFCPFPIPGADDWIGELANLIMGSLKNSLSGYRVECVLGLPELSTGLRFPTAGEVPQMVFGARTESTGWMTVGLEYTLNPNAEWQFDANVAAADDGDVCLF